jgi:flagellar FliL protein
MKGIIGKLIPAVAGLIVGAGGLIGLTIAMGGSFPPGAKAEAAATPAAHVEPHGVLYPTRERIVNLSDNGILRYLKTTIVLEISDPEAAKGGGGGDGHGKKGPPELPHDLKNKAAMIEDKITGVLTAKTATELMTPEGKQRLKDELKEGLNKALHDDRIMAVYFTDFIIQ